MFMVEEGDTHIVRMGIRRRNTQPSAVSKARRDAMHLIDEYKVRADTVRCECGWFGPANEFQPHRKENGVALSKGKH